MRFHFEMLKNIREFLNEYFKTLYDSFHEICQAKNIREILQH